GSVRGVGRRAGAGRALHELDEHTAGARGVEEGDAMAVGARARLLVDEADAGPAQAIQRGGEIRDGVGEVMEAGAAALEEPGDRGLGRDRLDQLEACVAAADERDRDALVGDALDRGTVPAGDELEDRKRLRDGADGDSDVVEREFGHGRAPGARSAAGWREDDPGPASCSRVRRSE